MMICYIFWKQSVEIYIDAFTIIMPFILPFILIFIKL